MPSIFGILKHTANFFSLISSIGLLSVICFMVTTLVEQQQKNQDRSGVVLPCGSIYSLELRQIPKIQLVARDISDPTLTRMHEMDVALTRVITRRGYGRIKPLIIELPDIDWKQGDSRPVTYALPLPETHSINLSGLADYYLTTRETMPTICLAVKSPYRWESFDLAFQQLLRWMREKNTLPTGKPRILLYDLQSFLSENSKRFEVQIPVR